MVKKQAKMYKIDKNFILSSFLITEYIHVSNLVLNITVTTKINYKYM